MAVVVGKLSTLVHAHACTHWHLCAYTIIGAQSTAYRVQAVVVVLLVLLLTGFGVFIATWMMRQRLKVRAWLSHIGGSYAFDSLFFFLLHK